LQLAQRTRAKPDGTVLYEAVRDNLATLLAEASEVGRGLPRYVDRDFAKYLECGVLAHGCLRQYLRRSPKMTHLCSRKMDQARSAEA
jgi:hypothetical protein